MDYGLEVNNIYDGIQIDSLYRNMVVIQRGVITSPYFANCGYRYDLAFNFNARPEAVMAVRPRGDNSVCSIGRTGSMFYAKVYSKSGTHEPLDYIIYGFPSAPVSTQDHGLQVFDPSGRKVFDSGYEYMKITDVMVFDVGSSSNYEYIVRRDIPSRKSGLYILSLTSACTSEQFGPVYFGYFPLQVKLISNSRVEVDNMSFSFIDDFTLFLVEPP
jgi:hypothetical protein